uniref:Bystin n=1 Tax=Rhabditophanes sp. KR3021 TaxID=114890 RepID=A0AC35U182_9BILA
MGKRKQVKAAVGDNIKASELPLAEQIESSVQASKRDTLRVKARDFKKGKEEEYVGGKLSAKVLKQARAQLLEEDDCDVLLGNKQAGGNAIPVFKQPQQAKVSSDGEDSDNNEDYGEYAEEEYEISPEEEEAMAKFYFANNTEKQRNLFDIIQAKIEESKDTIEKEIKYQDFDDVAVKDLDPNVIDLFQKVGEIMHSYRSGKIPKAFKIIPSMVNWEQVLSITNPEGWSDISFLAATRLFSASLNDKMCQRYYNLVLLPRLRDAIYKEKKLNFHLYQALRKSVFKTAAFFKGIVLPLCESGTCTLKEAFIVGSILNKAHIPVLHASAAMLKIAEMHYSGANSYFIRIFIEKKMTLPFRVLDGLVFHFLKMETETRELPVLWHQSLLAFIKHYRADISTEQREAIKNLLKTQSHGKVTPEIKKYLFTAESRNIESEQNVPDYVYDESMEF